MEKKLSSATKRAIERGYFDHDGTWFAGFEYTALTGDIGPTEGIVRRDPSRVIFFEGKYYVWYTRSPGEKGSVREDTGYIKTTPWDLADIWYATSEDGYDWKEIGQAVGVGELGQYDDRSVFTPEVLEHEGKYYLTYQCEDHPSTKRIENTVGMAIASNPNGPWTKLEKPILETSKTGKWLGEEDDRFAVIEKGDFDSLCVHDPCLMFYNDKFYLYYKGETKGEGFYMGGREIRWGVAIADKPEGPYVRSEYNPITNSGHEICVWHYDGGIAAMLTSDGMEKNTIQYSKDGVNFEIMGAVGRWEHAPHAAGLFPASESDLKTPLGGLTWGLHMVASKFDYIERFDLKK